MRRVLSTVLAALLMLAFAAAAFADDGSLGRSGETVYPIAEPAVRMEAEVVNLVISPDRTVADLTFTFSNRGAAREVLMGFPLEEKFEGRGNPVLHDFRTWVDGASVAVTPELGIAPKEPLTMPETGATLFFPGWMTWSVPFSENQTRTVRNAYWGRNSYWSNGEAAAGYILRTGAVWRESIGSATVTASLDGLLPSDLDLVYPTSYRWEGDRLRWEWQEFEPDRDIELRWNLRALEYSDQAGVKEAHRLYLTGDRDGALTIVRRELAAGVQHPFLAYVAVSHGLKPAAAFLEWPLNAVMRRWLLQRAGQEGAPPAMPELGFTNTEIPMLAVRLADPDGDIDVWGVTVWLEPDEGLTPYYTKPTWLYRRVGEPGSATLDLPGKIMGEYVWVRAWVADGEGHRQDTGLVQVTVPSVPSTVGPVPEPVPTRMDPFPPPNPTRVAPVGDPTPSSRILLWGAAALVSGGLALAWWIAAHHRRA